MKIYLFGFEEYELYLQKYTYFKGCVARLQREIACWEQKLLPKGINYEKVVSINPTQATQEAYYRIDPLDRQKKVYEMKLRLIDNFVRTVQDEEILKMIEERKKGKSWQDVSEVVHYSKEHCRRLVNKELNYYIEFRKHKVEGEFE